MAQATLEPLTSSSAGLSSAEAARLLTECGPNTLPTTRSHQALDALRKLWAPIPWMLEAAIILEIILGKFTEAAIIGLLLLFNAALGFIQEGRAQKTLDTLKSRLALSASVKRDGVWSSHPAADLVVNDIVTLSLGGVVPADVTLLDGHVLLDQSMLTGESMGSEAGVGFQTFAGALVRRGEAVARVTATGIRTKFGKTAELVRTAHVVSTQQLAVLHLVRNLAIFNGILIMALVVYALVSAIPMAEIIPLVLTAILASIPVALPATFTLASALGARALAGQGVLPTRLSAVDEAGTIDVLCADKTGTLTANQLTVTNVWVVPWSNDAWLLTMAALASSTSGDDPVDGAVRVAAAGHSVPHPPTLRNFTAFDSAKKMSEATAIDGQGGALRIIKGAYATVSALVPQVQAVAAAAQAFEARGNRVLAVAAGPPSMMTMLGLIALSDPARSDSATLITSLSSLGVRTVMVTGDAPATALIVARVVGIDDKPFPQGPIPATLQPDQHTIFSGVLPEDKYNLVKAFQASGHTVGMCGDGANDAPALRQAHMGIAVSTATDVAKSAAGMVLINPGLGGIVAAVTEGRITYQRILTYALNSVTKKIVQVLLLGIGLLMTGHAILTPMLMIIVMMAGDFLGMSLTTDHVKASQLPNRWDIGKLTKAGTVLGVAELSFCVGVVAIGYYGLRMQMVEVQTLAFIALVCGNQATMYAIRARGRIWSSPGPSRWLIASSVADLAIAVVMSTRGVLMAPLHVSIVLLTLAGSIAFAGLVDQVKCMTFRHLTIT